MRNFPSSVVVVAVCLRCEERVSGGRWTTSGRWVPLRVSVVLAQAGLQCFMKMPANAKSGWALYLHSMKLGTCAKANISGGMCLQVFHIR